MYLQDLLAGLLRRWYLVLIGLLITVGAGGYAYITTSPTYEAGASFLLLPPKIALVEAGNPYLYLGGLTQALEVLVRTVNSDEVSGPLADRYPDATFQVAQDTTTTGPIVLISVDAPNSDDAQAIVRALLEASSSSLDQMQDELQVAESSRIGMLRITEDTEPTEINQGRVRAALMIAAAGTVGTILLTGLFDGLLARRARRRSSDAAEAPSTAPATVKDADSLKEDQSIDTSLRDGDALAAETMSDAPSPIEPVELPLSPGPSPDRSPRLTRSQRLAASRMAQEQCDDSHTSSTS